METVLVNALLLITGGCIGSFASMLIYRLPRLSQTINIFSPRSFCPNCKTQLPIKSLIPILGFLFSKGECTYCKKKIDPAYLINELFIAILTVFVVNYLGALNPLSWLILLALIILYIQAMMDFKTLLLSQPLSIMLVLQGLCLNIGYEFFTVPLDSILGLIFGYGLLYCVNLLHRMIRNNDGIGSGDFLLLGAIGSIFGASAIGPILLLGSSITLLVYFLKNKDKSSELPLGFGLALGGIFYCSTFIVMI